MISPVMPVYPRHDVRFVKGEGCWLIDKDGRRYLDFLSGIAVNCFGHCHPDLIAALTEQAGKLWHISNFFHVPGQEELAKLYIENSFADTVFFTNSGVEAWECGLKVVRKYHYANGNPQRWRLITFEGCFHGRTIAAIAASKTEKMVKGFGPVADGFDQVPFGDLAALEAAITPETAGICVEPVQGEGGIRPWSEEQLRAIRALCDKHGILLFLDEIQCGAGRTGKLWAHEWAGIRPDVMAAAKGIGGGFPLGACLATGEAAKGMVVGTHGTTYGGNPMAMAVGRTVLGKLTAPGFLEGVQETAGKLRRAAEDVAARHPAVFSGVRGRGLMLGLVTRDGIDPAAMISDLLKAGLVTGAARTNVIRMVPPLVISDAEIAKAVEILDQVAGRARAAA